MQAVRVALTDLLRLLTRAGRGFDLVALALLLAVLAVPLSIVRGTDGRLTGVVSSPVLGVLVVVAMVVTVLVVRRRF